MAKTTENLEKKLKTLEEQISKTQESMSAMTMDEASKAPKEEYEPSHRLSQNEIRKAPDTYLKPIKTLFAPGQKFNEAFRKDYEYQKELVCFIAEHKEMQGEKIEKWTRPFGGLPAEFWEIHTGIPVWGPRYLAESLKAKAYHRLVMKENVFTESNYAGKMYGAMAADSTIQRLDAHPVSKTRSIFSNASSF